jgi:NTE family protein
VRITAVDLERGIPVILERGPLLAAVRATCAVPGVMLPEKIDGRWLVDGGLINLVPVDVVWPADPDAVIAISVSAHRAHRMPQLDWKLTRLLSRVGRMVPNPATAKVSFEILVRSAEIALGHSAVLANAMAAPDLLLEIDLEDIGLRDFHRVDDAVARGRAAAVRALPALRAVVATPPPAAPSDAVACVEVDPVCRMMIGARRARARAIHAGRSYAFCSENCRDAFVRAPDGYLHAP